ncbi:MAG TPA: pyridine nucleotide-disulfide oxidoreductase, partial [Treponemataceae bacterium]|nr:pyridine nucleotide-disulfide oxidoreductase [Treponemataceae bacterium]
MTEVQDKILEFANKVSGKKVGAKGAVTVTDARYKILEPLLTEEMVDVALSMKMRTPMTVEEIAAECGKSIEDTKRIVWELAMAGVSILSSASGEDKFWYEPWVPGIMEMIVNSKENIRKHPEVAESFERYGVENGPRSIGSFPAGTGLMRVIPIESAIDGESRRASYEEIST